MGMYTELFISTRIKDAPGVATILKFMLADVGTLETPPNHPLFRTKRWQSMLRMSSHYFVPRAMSLFEYDDICKAWVLISRSDFKNYDDEIAKFINWIRPHLACSAGEMIGYYRYEESHEPTIIYSTELK